MVFIFRIVFFEQKQSASLSESYSLKSGLEVSDDFNNKKKR
jgi:hypothetical protein